MKTLGSGGARIFIGWVCLGAVGLALAQEQPVAVSPVSDSDPRAVLSAEREAQSLRLDQTERDCYARFLTSSCLREVARSRRAMQADIKRKEAALDAADRQQRAQDAQRRLQEKMQEQTQRQNDIDPRAIEESQRQKQSDQETKQREHAAKSASVPAPAASGVSAPSSAPKPPSVPLPSPVKLPSPPKAPKADPGPSAPERAANQAVFEKRQAEAQRRLADRAQGAASAASAARSLPLPLPPAPVEPVK